MIDKNTGQENLETERNMSCISVGGYLCSRARPHLSGQASYFLAHFHHTIFILELVATTIHHLSFWALTDQTVSFISSHGIKLK